jgi:hypothetical protein
MSVSGYSQDLNFKVNCDPTYVGRYNTEEAVLKRGGGGPEEDAPVKPKINKKPKREK